MKTFIIETKTKEDWGIIGGIYVVNAEKQLHAKEIVEKLIKCGHYGKGEVITNITKVNDKPGIIFESHPIIE